VHQGPAWPGCQVCWPACARHRAGATALVRHRPALVNEERIEHWLDRHGAGIGVAAPRNLTPQDRAMFSRHGTALVVLGAAGTGIRTLDFTRASGHRNCRWCRS